MNIRTLFGWTSVLAVLCWTALIGPAARSARACGDYGKVHVQDVLSEDPETSSEAIRALRELGPRGLDMLLKYDEKVGPNMVHAPAAPSPQEHVARVKRLEAAIDAVAGQRNARASRLYWYTDLESAKAEASRIGKPILSLRMLGNLTDEMSCANSRFFRTALYANAEISKALRENFVLHWKSVRPVPIVTIDFGDGRKIERTITGNSIHYVLTSDGEVVDGLPGLYGPGAFLREVTLAGNFAQALSKAPVDGRADAIKTAHARRLLLTERTWRNELAALEVNVEKHRTGSISTCRRVSPLDYSQFAEDYILDTAELAAATTDAVWAKLAERHAADAVLDQASVNLMRTHRVPLAFAAGALARGKMVVENPILRMVAAFQNNMALDTVKNEYLLRRELHQWLAGGVVEMSLDQLNDRVYAQLFLTPSNDPWLGLVSNDDYTGLPAGGVAVAQPK